MQEVDGDEVVVHKFRQPVHDDMEYDNDLRANRGYTPRKQAHYHDHNDGNIVEAGKDSNYLPQTFGCEL